ncbi:MAG: (2Fe-2S)-binding protein [Chloroflexi bacterium]|nr:(2Fe-2S)-binding protein [Chloroflexota bacterium]
MTTAHPLARTAARIVRRSPWLGFGFVGDGVERDAPVPPWGGVRYGDLLRPDLMDLALRHVAEETHDHPRVTGTFAVLGLGWAARVWTACLLLDRRVPLDPMTEATTGPTATEPDGSIVLPSGRFACLATDRAAGHPDAHPVATLAELHATHQRLVGDAMMAPAVDAIVERRLIGRKALAGMVGSRLAAVAVLLARGPEERRRMSAEVLTLAEGHAVSRAALPVFYEVPKGSGHTLAHVRGTCCLYYELPDGVKCEGTCPIAPEGLERLRAARRGAAEA